MKVSSDDRWRGAKLTLKQTSIVDNNLIHATAITDAAAAAVADNDDDWSWS